MKVLRLRLVNYFRNTIADDAVNRRKQTHEVEARFVVFELICKILWKSHKTSLNDRQVALYYSSTSVRTFPHRVIVRLRLELVILVLL